MVNTTGIYRVVARARRRLRCEAALRALTVALVPSSALVLLSVVLVQRRLASADTGVLLYVAAGAVLAGAVAWGMTRRFATESVATRIDRASGLSDRLATACHFDQVLARGDDQPAETEALMRAAIADAVRAVPRADVSAATPIRLPRNAELYALFAAVCGLVAAFAVPPAPTAPRVSGIEPAAAVRGSEVLIRGVRFCGPDDSDVATEGGCAGPEGTVSLHRPSEDGVAGAPLALDVVRYESRSITATVPLDTPVGVFELRVAAKKRSSNPMRFEVLAEDDPRAVPPDRVALEEDDLDYTRDLVAELRQTARDTGDLELEKLADALDQLLDQAERGEITKKELLEKLAATESEYMKGSEKALEEALSDLSETGKELKKSKLTQELGKKLEKRDLEGAQKQLEELAEKIAENKISDRDAKEIAEAMEKAADKLEKAQNEREKKDEGRLDQTEREVDKLRRQLEKEENQKKREQLERQLKKKERELKQLKRDKQEREQSLSKRELKRLSRDMKKAAEQMKQPRTQKSRRQIEQTMKDMARRAGKVSSDKRKMANQSKVTSQMNDLKEALRRARQRGSRGPKNRFGRNRKNQDYEERVAGGQGQKGAWKPGQGQGQGQGQGKGNQGQKPGGQGQKPGGDEYGEGHDPNLLGDPTKLSGNTEDESLQGAHGQGQSVRETILTSAQKGFANRSYKDVYARYKTIVEEVIKAENVPSGYKYYVKKYFQKIKPHEM